MEKNKPRICKICNRRFANGKAMGGHMRSHLLKLKLAPPPSNSLSSPPSSSSLTKHDHHHQQQLLSSEAESSKTGRRSKRLRKNNSPPSDSVSSFPSLSCEDAALCLLMLSKDHQWWGIPKSKFKTEVDYDTSLDEEDVDFDNENDDEFSAKTHSKYYRCETCNRSFRSHQALGGHRASHNHKNKQIMEEDDDDDEEENYEDDHEIHHQRRIFECPFCEKVFQSGQALGGHKKVHFAYLPVAAENKASTNTSSSNVQSFDLNNLPASDDEEVSLVRDATPS